MSIVVLFPVLAEAYGIWLMAASYAEFGLYALLGMIGVTIATLLAGLQFLYILMYYFCSRCVNFSCPLNRVPKFRVDGYLAKNSVMKDAWQRSGYTLGNDDCGGSEMLGAIQLVQKSSRSK